MRPTGPQGLIRRRFRIRARAGRAEAPGAIARISRRIDMSHPLHRLPKVARNGKRSVTRSGAMRRSSGNRGGDARREYVSKDDLLAATFLLASHGIAAAQSCGTRIGEFREIVRTETSMGHVEQRSTSRPPRRVDAHRQAFAAPAATPRRSRLSRRWQRRHEIPLERLLEMIAPDIPADGLVGLRGPGLLAQQPVSGPAIERERGLLQLGCAQRQHRRAGVAARVARRSSSIARASPLPRYAASTYMRRNSADGVPRPSRPNMPANVSPS